MNIIKQIINEEIKKIISEGKYDHIDFKPPKGVASEAEKGLEYRKKNSGKGGTRIGVQRATNLKNRDNVSPDTITRMVSFFARHKGNEKVETKHKNTPWKDEGNVSWLLWGGDAGKRWAKKIKGQMDKINNK